MNYYNHFAEISDAEFDIWDELKRLDPNNAVLHEWAQNLSLEQSK